MDPRDRLRALLEQASCTVCGDGLAPGSARVLAEREDLAFVEMPCESCGAVTLAMISIPEGLGLPGLDDIETAAIPDVDPADRAPVPSAAPFAGDDVLDMHGFLADWQGGLRELLDRPAGRDHGTPGIDR
jgi:hypothetical protein